MMHAQAPRWSKYVRHWGDERENDLGQIVVMVNSRGARSLPLTPWSFVHRPEIWQPFLFLVGSLGTGSTRVATCGKKWHSGMGSLGMG